MLVTLILRKVIDMESITKTPLSREVIIALLKNTFGNYIEVSEVKEIEDGWFNAIYLIYLNDDREVVLKVAPPTDVKVLRYEKNIMRTEVEVMELIKSRTNVPVPKIYIYDTSGTIIENEYFIMEKVKGKTYNLIKEGLPEEKKKIIEIELGKYNKQINNIKNNRFGSIAQKEKTSSKWSEAFLNLVRDILMDGKEYEVKLPFDYDYIEALFLENVEIFDTITEACLVHWDLHDGNVLANENGNKINGIIDFERAFWGDPLIEIYFGDFYNKTYFNKGYGIELLNSEEAVLKRILYNIYLYLIMVIECKYRNVQNQEHIRWTYTTLENEINKYNSKRLGTDLF
jgi:aminoglycoside phosphotransferase (APT) family kinase protein